MKYLIHLFISLCILSYFILIESGCTRNNDNITSPNNGGQNDTFAVVWRTTNGGGTWLKDSVHGIFSFEDIAQTGDGSVMALSSDGYVFRTTNYGISWENYGRVGEFFPTDLDFYWEGGLGFITATNTIYETTNYGSSWSVVSSGSGSLFDIDFFDFENGICIGAGWGTQSLRTTNGGAVWTGLTALSNTFLFDVETVGIYTAYAVGRTNTNDTGMIMRTTDGGENWTRIKTLNNINTGLNGITIELIGNNYIGISYGDGGIYRSTDIDSNWNFVYDGGVIIQGDDYNNAFYLVGGNKIFISSNGINWGVLNGPANWRFRAITFIDNNTGFVVGGRAIQ